MSSKSSHLVPHASPIRLAVLGALLIAAVSGGCASGGKKAAQAASPPAAFWPPYPDEPRLQFLTSYSTSADVQPAQSKLDDLIYGKDGKQVLPLNKPYGVEMSNGKIYVCDLRNGSVTVLDLKGRRVLILGKTPADSLQTPVDIAVAPDGRKYVADTGRGMIAVYGPDDRRVGAFAQKGFKPVGVAVHKDELYACDFQGSRVLVMNRHNGQVVRTIGEPGGGPGQFVRPLGISVDAQGNVYVMDVMKCQLQKFDPQGNVVTTFGTISARAGGLVRPKHIDVDKDGTIYAVDAAFQNVQLFDQGGHVLTFFGTPGAHPGSMYLPAGVCVHEGDVELFRNKIHPAFQAERLVLVTNQFGPNKVSVYAMGRLRPGKTVQDIASSQGLTPAGVDETRGKGVPVVPPAGSEDLIPQPGEQPGEQPGAEPAAVTTASPTGAPAAAVPAR